MMYSCTLWQACTHSHQAIHSVDFTVDQTPRSLLNLSQMKAPLSFRAHKTVLRPTNAALPKTRAISSSVNRPASRPSVTTTPDTRPTCLSARFLLGKAKKTRTDFFRDLTIFFIYFGCVNKAQLLFLSCEDSAVWRNSLLSSCFHCVECDWDRTSNIQYQATTYSQPQVVFLFIYLKILREQGGICTITKINVHEGRVALVGQVMGWPLLHPSLVDLPTTLVITLRLLSFLLPPSALVLLASPDVNGAITWMLLSPVSLLCLKCISPADEG